uniref:Polymerase nucleotidyl transferase domain-containing protein n=1 Tax=Chromera velia CCMP2878 TaxID=1169474 RepID=A0A0G4HQ56_9ALVE|eukprot:Cvel_7883.t1-p1 / transcript=Cvel_7883.t1 / gene=Cvel_7883 / organism=Chromera_velia_CCMP2878 / gene_product=hypothetical protein / transcript_product=hypothetical protein / location=Cvel_scaffold422:80849-82886(+) / protein_length=373 / sequence_SO=supercontig / SO=protein_coding / is_pseudo=false
MGADPRSQILSAPAAERGQGAQLSTDSEHGPSLTMPGKTRVWAGNLHTYKITGRTGAVAKEERGVWKRQFGPSNAKSSGCRLRPASRVVTSSFVLDWQPSLEIVLLESLCVCRALIFRKGRSVGLLKQIGALLGISWWGLGGSSPSSSSSSSGAAGNGLEDSSAALQWLRGNVVRTQRIGSVALGLESERSDIDLLVVLREGGEDVVDRLFRALVEMQKVGWVRETHPNFANATLERHLYAVSIRQFRRSTEFDLMPVVLGGEGGREMMMTFSERLQRWEPAVMPLLSREFTRAFEETPALWKALRVLKGWNDQLPKLRRNSRGEGKAPIVSMHIPCLALLARNESECLKEVSESSTLVLDLTRVLLRFLMQR